jgi:hypothetical protein
VVLSSAGGSGEAPREVERLLLLSLLIVVDRVLVGIVAQVVAADVGDVDVVVVVVDEDLFRLGTGTRSVLVLDGGDVFGTGEPPLLVAVDDDDEDRSSSKPTPFMLTVWPGTHPNGYGAVREDDD